MVTFNDLRDEWSHGNTVIPLGDDRVMFSFRNISTVGVIDKASGEIVWQIGDEVLAQQHDPSMLDNGNVLIYDNGSHSRHSPLPASRVIEVNTSTNEIVWQYRDNPPFNFFSAYISGARRLPNGKHADHRGPAGAHLPGDARRRGGVGVHQPALRAQRAGLRGQQRLPLDPLPARASAATALKETA